MSPEIDIFIDAVMELGFTPAEDYKPVVTPLNTGHPVGMSLYRAWKTEDGARWATACTVVVYSGHVEITWWNGQRSPRFSYLIPEQWPDALERMRQVIRLAEEAARTGALPAGPLEPEWGINNWRIHQRRT